MSEIKIGENGNWYIDGVDTGKSSRGQAGLSAYHIAVSYGYRGDMFKWLNDLKGESAYNIAVQAGYTGTEEEWVKSLEGVDGLTPYVGENGNWFIGNEDTGVLADAEKAVEKKIVASTDIKEAGMLMDGKTVSEALAEVNKKFPTFNSSVFCFGDMLMQWGYTSTSSTNAAFEITFPEEFVNANYYFAHSWTRNPQLVTKSWVGDASGNDARTTKSCRIYVNRTTQSYSSTVTWLAIGRRKNT